MSAKTWPNSPSRGCFSNLIEEDMRLQAKLGVSVPTAILASETLETMALEDFEGRAWTRLPGTQAAMPIPGRIAKPAFTISETAVILPAIVA